ncbi:MULTISPECIES: 5-oxoprolinase subunit PxpB [unclassified Pseudoalteromonas]|uniref:5-oxoprolinase subunit PxpB n=1 Tax=unclassified Pseudoalteromonas TaxID=194690 RepID=UPI001F485CDF|nr:MULTISPECIES: 5-oxoprolinase subunit PxpB [unclassified Pseudoalteromonas]MDP2634699.1 5-oxoprolinase subunit PxpB [Pseudoalteromonas sp. 1_MG-2023]
MNNYSINVMNLQQNVKITATSSHTLFLDATHLKDPLLSVQKKIWALVKRCKATAAFIDIVPAMNSLTLYLANSDDSNQWQEKLLLWWETTDIEENKGTHHKIITQYGGNTGADLEFIAEHHGVSTQRVIELHTSVTYHVLFLGFKPGFTYIHGLPSELHTPRRSEPRTHVPKGSVAIGADQTGIYPADSPGGWHIIGHTDFSLFDWQKAPPCAIAPGDTLQFISDEALS